MKTNELKLELTSLNKNDVLDQTCKRAGGFVWKRI